MRLINVLLPAIFCAWSTFISAASQLGTGLVNENNICYMNALLSCLYDVTPFRKAVYEHYEESVLIRALAGVFGRKQLNLLPSISLEGDMMTTVQHLTPHWDFGTFQDVDEFLKLIFAFFPPSITNIIGYEARERSTTLDGRYVVNEGVPLRVPMVTVHLPDRPQASLDFQELVNAALGGFDTREYTFHRTEHPEYFRLNNIRPPVSRAASEIMVQQRVTAYADVVPVFVARRTNAFGSNRETFRKDLLTNLEMITFPLDDGQTADFTLTAFVVYVPGHYYAVTKSFPSRQWLCYNDESVTVIPREKIISDLQKSAVMLFYVKKGSSCETEIPAHIRDWSMTSLIVQHMQNDLVRRVKKLVKSSRR